jgi:hypothetical protein
VRRSSVIERDTAMRSSPLGAGQHVRGIGEVSVIPNIAVPTTRLPLRHRGQASCGRDIARRVALPDYGVHVLLGAVAREVQSPALPARQSYRRGCIAGNRNHQKALD